jgi:hypothetical protein
MSMVTFSISMSLLDSLSTTAQIIVFVLLLTTAKPIRNALVYLAGLSGAYFACGLAGYLALDQLRVWLSTLLPSQASVSNVRYYQSEFLTGLILAAIGIWYFYWKKKRGWSERENWFFLKLRTMNGWFALSIGVLISVTSFPCSPPYLIALGKYAALHPDLPSAAGLILIYNAGYALPMILILLVYLIVRRDTDDYHDTLHEKAKMLNLHLTTWTLVGFGLFSMIDAGCYFAIGHALLKERYF